MAAVLLVMLLGAGIGALGLLLPDLYVVGILVLFVGAVGLLVRGAELARRMRR